MIQIILNNGAIIECNNYSSVVGAIRIDKCTIDINNTITTFKWLIVENVGIAAIGELTEVEEDNVCTILDNKKY